VKQRLQRFGSMAGVGMKLVIRRLKPRMVRQQCPTSLQTHFHRCRDFALQWIAGADQPPDPIKSEAIERLAGYMNMSGMRRIERSPEKTDGPAR